MKRITTLLAVVALLATPSAGFASGDVMNFINFGCQVAWGPAHGCFLSDLKGPVAPGLHSRGTKTGKACGWNLLALFSVGDVRISTAMRDGGITKVSAVDNEIFELIPFFYGFSTYCTVVHGE